MLFFVDNAFQTRILKIELEMSIFGQEVKTSGTSIAKYVKLFHKTHVQVGLHARHANR